MRSQSRKLKKERLIAKDIVRERVPIEYCEVACE